MNLAQLQKISLSNRDIMELVGNRSNLVLYPDIHKYETIDQLMGPYGSCILLYESKPSYGHWVVVFKLEDGGIEFFNSYGDGLGNGYPDDSLKFINPEFREESDQDHTYLLNLMMNSNYPLSYNQYKFQKKGSEIRTCGRHVACRLLYRHLSLDEYHKFIMKYCKQFRLDPDGVVTMMTTQS